MRKIRFCSERDRVSILICLPILIVSLVLLSIAYSVTKHPVPLIFLILFALCIPLVIIALIKTNKAINRRQWALLGKRSTAIVRSVTMLRDYSRKGAYKAAYGYIISYKYEAESGESIIGYYQVSVSESRYFMEGESIPIYLNGDYGCFRMSDIISFRKGGNRENFFICPYCCSKVSNYDNCCPNCGARM